MMNLASNPERIFPLSGDPAVPGNFYTPRLLSQISATPGFVMGNRAFMRAWAARRAARQMEAAGFSSSTNDSPASEGCRQDACATSEKQTS